MPHSVLFTSRTTVIFDFTNKPMTYWVSTEASGPTGHEFVKKFKFQKFSLIKFSKKSKMHVTVNKKKLTLNKKL